MAKMGRPKGSPNVYTKDIRAQIREALQKAGGVKYLTQLALENPSTFAALLGRSLPKEIEVQADTKLEITWVRPVRP